MAHLSREETHDLGEVVVTIFNLVKRNEILQLTHVFKLMITYRKMRDNQRGRVKRIQDITEKTKLDLINNIRLE